MRHIFGSAYMQVYILHSFFIQLTFFHHKSYVEMIDLLNANRRYIVKYLLKGFVYPILISVEYIVISSRFWTFIKMYEVTQ